MYAYAFMETPTSPLKLPYGIAGRVEVLSSAHLSALVEADLSWETLQDNDELLMQAVLSHDRVVCELFAQMAVLPLRFGTCFVGRERLEEYLDSHARLYREKLAFLKGKAEYTLKCRLLEEEVSARDSELGGRGKGEGGREYFLAKKQLYQLQRSRQRQQEQEWQSLLGAISQFYPDSVQGESKGNVECIYLLGSREEELLLMRRVQDWQVQCSSWELSLGNALPPYHFA